MMKTFAIVLQDNTISELGYQQLVESSEKVGNNFKINRLKAITPDIVDKTIEVTNIRWNYPWEGTILDLGSGLKKSAYQTKNPKARIACALSHYALWVGCVANDETYLILEHDAYFVNKIDFDPENTKALVLGINNPLGATRKAMVYYASIIANNEPYQLVPWIDDDRQVPQGLAGNSAYIIKPKGAQTLIDLVDQYGLWPNDAIMCRQLMPGLGVTRKFYTIIQGLESTTTL
jgi:GR25 family glycosyltransferase involved in LPS biosynthesis